MHSQKCWKSLQILRLQSLSCINDNALRTIVNLTPFLEELGIINRISCSNKSLSYSLHITRDFFYVIFYVLFVPIYFHDRMSGRNTDKVYDQRTITVYLTMVYCQF